jgi:hypothetical protein
MIEIAYHLKFKKGRGTQPVWVYEIHGISLTVRISIDATLKTNRIACQPPTKLWIIVAMPAVYQSGSKIRDVASLTIPSKRLVRQSILISPKFFAISAIKTGIVVVVTIS